MATNQELTEALESMCYQFAGWSERTGGYSADGLSALEGAFVVLGWDNPMSCPKVCCDEPGCKKQKSCGWNSPTGYRQTCSKHNDRNRKEQEDEAKPMP